MPDDPYQYRFSEEQKQVIGNVAHTAGKILLPGPTALVDFLKQRPLQKTPGLDFLINPTSYPAGTRFNNPMMPDFDEVAWNTYETRKAKEAAGTWQNTSYQYQSNDTPLNVAEQHGVTPQQLINANPGGYPFDVGQTISVPQYVQTTQPTSTPTTPQGTGVMTEPTQPYGGFQNLNGSDGSDYANTKAAQYYAAAGTPFLKQQRYDPQTKKFVSIGKLIKQGKLDLQGNWHKRSNRQKITAATNRNQAQQQQQQDHTLTNSIIKFGVSSG